MSVLFAATYPARTTALILCGTFAVGPQIARDNPGGRPWVEVGEAMLDAIDHWGEGRTLPLFAPSVAGSETWRRVWSGFERAALSPAMARALWQLVSNIDVRPVLPAIRVPTLVLRRSRDFIPVALSRQLVERIEERVMPSSKATIWRIRETSKPWSTKSASSSPVCGGTPASTGYSRRCSSPTSLARPSVRPRWAIAAGAPSSTRTTISRGRELERYRGHEIEFAGDGLLATFDGPARAIHCALALIEEQRALGLEIRAGLHTGEIELAGNAVRGIAVHIGARVAAEGEAGEVLVSSTVKDLVAGSGIRFADRGLHVLKGVPGEWQLFRAEA